MFRGIYHWVCSILERPISPLTRLQAWKLQGLPLEGLVMEPDNHSLRSGTEPTCMYAFLDGRYIGTAYGDRVDAPRSAMKRPEVRGVVAKIEACYLPKKAKLPADSEFTIDPEHDDVTRMQAWLLNSFPNGDITVQQENTGYVHVFYKGELLGTAHGDQFVAAEGALRHIDEITVFKKIEEWYKPRSRYESDDIHDAD